ncbi:hypothetical protein Bca52824_001268 [Brassica carinata]|uniref:Uncharacterized protein n=1 Tax=Brassica carinata TaxID=52824 RepID=A0A8X7WL66_BRACI|nr:hypothetical protein Bca52824_001268 [Brassica carinata]
MNVVVEKYDTALKKAREELSRVEEESAEKEKLLSRQLIDSREELSKLTELMSRVVSRRDQFKDELEASREAVKELERRNAELESEKASAALAHEREAKRLRDSRVFEVSKERVRVEAAMVAKVSRRFDRIRAREARRGPYDNARLLYSQAFGTRKCLEVLKGGGTEIP